MTVTRRSFLHTLGGLALSSLAPGARSDTAPDRAAGPSDWCGGGGGSAARPLFIPSEHGYLGRLALDERPLTLRAAPLPSGVAAGGGLTQGYLARYQGREFVNPTLVLRPGQRVRIELDNSLDEATIVHWHGLALDTRNDGAGITLAAPGGRYAYDFEVRNRGALYWYHPHPHGLTAGQAYRGLFGAFEISDEDEAKLRATLDLVPGKREIPLLLQDRRGADYAASPADQMHGYLGDTVYVNGTACPYLDVATRLYRFRVLNASNARTYRLGWRTAAGTPLPFTLIGNDGGLLPAPQTCSEAFLATAERLDLLLDLSDLAVGDTVLLDTRRFDPMHMEMGAMGHGGATPAAGATEHAAMQDSGSFPEGTARTRNCSSVRAVPSGKLPP